jgi:hypothetical protein
MNFNLKKIALAFTLSTSFAAFATTGTPITRQLQASYISVSGTTSIKGLDVVYANVSAAGSLPQSITSVAYSLVAYPPQGGAETVQICYSTPYSSTVGNCQTVLPGSSGTITAFNTLKFGRGVFVWIRHSITGGTFPAMAPTTKDSLTINWKY